MTSPSEPAAAIPAARVIALWDSISERNWTLRETLLEFARLILAEAAQSEGHDG